MNDAVTDGAPGSVGFAGGLFATNGLASLVILDEPTAGLDPIASGIFKDKIRSAPGAGTTVLLTSHILSEIEELAEDIIFLIEGRVVFQGPIPLLLEQAGATRLERAVAALMERGRWRRHTLLLLGVTILLLRFGGSGERALLGLVNLVLRRRRSWSASAGRSWSRPSGSRRSSGRW